MAGQIQIIKTFIILYLLKYNYLSAGIFNLLSPSTDSILFELITIIFNLSN